MQPRMFNELGFSCKPQLCRLMDSKHPIGQLPCAADFDVWIVNPRETACTIVDTWLERWEGGRTEMVMVVMIISRMVNDLSNLAAYTVHTVKSASLQYSVMTAEQNWSSARKQTPLSPTYVVHYSLEDKCSRNTQKNICLSTIHGNYPKQTSTSASLLQCEPKVISSCQDVVKLCTVFQDG